MRQAVRRSRQGASRAFTGTDVAEGRSEFSTGVQKWRRPPGRFWDWHNESRRQYSIILSGQIEVVVGDGSRRRFSPGDVVLGEDLTGQGHTTRIVSEVPWVYVTIPVAGSGVAETQSLT